MWGLQDRVPQPQLEMLLSGLETEMRRADSGRPHNAGGDTLMAGGMQHMPLLVLCSGDRAERHEHWRTAGPGVPGTYSASAVHVGLGVCSRGSGTHGDSKRIFPTHGARKYKKGAGEMAQVPWAWVSSTHLRSQGCQHMPVVLLPRRWKQWTPGTLCLTSW